MKCVSPTLVNVDGKSIYVPCGRCAWCRKRKRDEWFFRLKVEQKNHLVSRFITLTYDDEHLKFNVNEETGEMVPIVNKRDLQLFHKDLRNHGYVFRFMVNSEYGPKTKRPHYHGVYFSDQLIPYTEFWKNGQNNTDYPAKDSSLKYICKYMLKGSVVPDGADPNFSLSSRRPGIGSSFIYKGEPYILAQDGVKLAPGHYYRRKYLNSLDEKIRKVESEKSIDYLLTADPFNQLQHDYEKYGHGEDFLTYVYNVYELDNKQQKKINSK